MSQTEALYDDAQANEILRTAVRLSAPGEITFEELLAAAKELGTSREELKDAEEKYHHNSSEVGQREEFRQMQKHEWHLAIFHTLLLFTIACAVVLIDLSSVAGSAIPLLAFAGVIYLAYKYWDTTDQGSTRNVKAFSDWKQKKKLWLKPERAKKIVDSIVREELKILRGPTIGSSRSRIIDDLRERLSYDKKRARSVFDAYMREHPEIEVKLKG